MGEVEELLAAAVERSRQIVGLANLLLEAEQDPERVHRRYVSAAVDLSEEVQARALLAGAGDAGALTRLRLLVGELDGLASEAANELSDQG